VPRDSDCQHLLPEGMAEVTGRCIGRLLKHWKLAEIAHFQLQAGDFAVGDAAGDDPLEVAQVGVRLRRSRGW
jgi:hypothetical protein